MVRPLRESERQQAYEQAREWVAGPEPEFHRRISLPTRYPKEVVYIVLALCFVVLIAAFVPSSLRLKAAGSEEFCRTSPGDSRACDVVGISAVMLAEVGSLVFILSLSVVSGTALHTILNRDVDVVRIMLWLSALTCTVIAVVGNAYIGKPFQRQEPFDVLIVFAPPFLVLVVGYVLKDMLLQIIASHHDHVREHGEKLVEWKRLLEDPERSDRWLRFYSRALKEQLQRANRRAVEELEVLTRPEWERLILREMNEANWQVDPAHAVAVTVPTLPVSPSHPQLTTPTGIKDGDIWQNPDGTWTARLPGTEQILGTKYREEAHARMAITMKQRSLLRGG